MSNNKYNYAPNLHNDYSIQGLSSPPCGIKSKVLATEIFNLVKDLLPAVMFDPITGRLKDNATRAVGTLGFIESLIIKEKLIEQIVPVDIDQECLNIKATAELRQLDLIMTIGYSQVLLNNYHNSDPLNSNEVLATLYNFTTIQIDGFAYLSPYDDFAKYTNPKNYKLSFILNTFQDQYAPTDLPFVGVISQGDVLVTFVEPTP